jgi:O-6-methylguanine DNA methyltransferase
LCRVNAPNARAERVFIREASNTANVKSKGKEKMIEVYTQNFAGTWFAVALNGPQIVTSTFGNQEQVVLNNILTNLPFNAPFQVLLTPTASAKTALIALKEIYDGKDTNAQLPLVTTHLPPYAKKVLKATLSIPVGYVTSYGAIADAVGGGARAVGNAMACNLFPPIVPCHRVVKSDLTLGGYGGGGLKVKMDFLKRERRGYTIPKDIVLQSGVLKVFPVEYVLSKLEAFNLA